MSPDPASSPAEIRLLLLGSVTGYLAHLRGLFPLHGACIGIQNRAVVFVGPSGAGKSTIAAHLSGRGHRLIADDVSVTEIIDGVVSVRPAFPRLKLCPDAFHALAAGAGDSDRHPIVRNKFHVRQPGPFRAEPAPLGAIVLLEQPDAGEPDALIRLASAPAIMARLHAETFRPVVPEALNMLRPMFDVSAEIARNVPVYRWRRRFDLARIDVGADQLEALVAR